MGFLDALFGPSENLIKITFQEGKEAGIREGIEIARKRMIENSNHLTESEYREVIDFLIARNIELCYDHCINGFRIRKRIYGDSPIFLQPEYGPGYTKQ